MEKFKAFLLIVALLVVGSMLPSCGGLGGYPVHDSDDYYESKEKAMIDDKLYEYEIYKEGYEAAKRDILGASEEETENTVKVYTKDNVDELAEIFRENETGIE